MPKRPAIAAFLAGTALLVTAIAVSVTLRDAAVTVPTAVAGCALILFAFVGGRLESFGPKGVTLRELKERAEDRLELAGFEIKLGAPEPKESDAAAAIRAAKNPEELIDTLVNLIERPESNAERLNRVRKDEKARATLRSIDRRQD